MSSASISYVRANEASAKEEQGARGRPKRDYCPQQILLLRAQKKSRAREAAPKDHRPQLTLPARFARSYDFDSDPVNRRMTPKFYGYLPDDGRTRLIMYLCMVLNSALLLLLRSFSAALLMLARHEGNNKFLFSSYLAIDMSIFLLLKVLRGDFLYVRAKEGERRARARPGQG
jgi:hypothetical protein